MSLKLDVGKALKCVSIEIVSVGKMSSNHQCLKLGILRNITLNLNAERKRFK